MIEFEKAITMVKRLREFALKHWQGERALRIATLCAEIEYEYYAMIRESKTR